MVEGETVEETGDDVQEKFAGHVVGSAPVSRERALDNRVDLGADWHGVLAVVGGLAFVGDLTALFEQGLYLLVARFVFRRGCPHVAPVFAFVVGIAGPDRLKHVLGRIAVRWAFLGAVLLEVVDKSPRVLA